MKLPHEHCSFPCSLSRQFRNSFPHLGLFTLLLAFLTISCFPPAIAQITDTIEPIYLDHWHFDTPYYLSSVDDQLLLSAGNHIGFFSTQSGEMELQKLNALQKGHNLDDAPSGLFVDADTVWAGMTHAGMSKYILSESPLAHLDWSYEIFDDSFYDVSKSGSSIIYGKGLFVPKIISLSISGVEPVSADTLFGNMSHHSWDVSDDLLAVTDIDHVYLYRVLDDGIFSPEFSLPLEHDSPGWRAHFGEGCVIVMHVDGDLSLYEVNEDAEQVISLELRSVLETRCNYGEIDLHESRVYVAGNGRLHTVDITDISSPSVLQTVESDYLYELDQLVYHNGDAYALRRWSLHPEKFLRITLSELSP